LTTDRHSFSFDARLWSQPRADAGLPLAHRYMNEPVNPVAAELTELARRAREFVDADGNVWTVSEQPFSEYDRRRGCSLIFESDLAVRRVRNYPADWHGLSDAALHRLSWST
jgi:hypothetical protein